MKLLVCGGAGFIGSNFVHYILETYPHYEVVNYDKLTYAGNLDNLKDIESNLQFSSRYTFIHGDICDSKLLSEVIEKYKITHIINFAAETHVDRSIHGDCIDFVMTNTYGVLMILNAIRKYGLEKFVNVSTDEVYGSLDFEENRKFLETTAIDPNMPYAAAKAGGDMLCHAYYATHKLPIVVTHCSNNYGPYQYPEKLVPMSIFRLLKNRPIPMHGSGRNVRDWIYVRDHCAALDLMLQKGAPGEVYNVGVDNERTNLDVAKMILYLMNKSDDMIEFVEDRPGNDKRYAIDASKLHALGWKPVYTRDQFEMGMSETINWYLTNHEWVKNLWARNDDAFKINHTPELIKKKKNMKLKFEKTKIKTLQNDKAAYGFVELKDFIDFEIKRVYYIYNCKQATGQHCHKEEKEFFVMQKGGCTAIIDSGSGKEDVRLEIGDAIYVGAYVWHGFKDFTDDAFVLAMSSTNYGEDRSDYVEDYEEYKQIVE